MERGKKYNPVSRRGNHYQRDTVGIGRVILQSNIDRDLYIKHCYQCGTVSVLSRVNLDIVHDVEVDPDVLQRVRFPETTEQLGSTVVWINLPIYDRPILIGLLNDSDEMSTQVEEGEFSLLRFDKKGTVSISGKARGSQIDIVASSTTDSGGRLRVNILNNNGTAELSVSVYGKLFIESLTGIVKLRDSFELSVNDGKRDTKSTFIKFEKESIESRVEESDSGYTFSKEGFEIGKATEPAVLADSLNSFMKSLIDVIASQTVSTSLGPQPLVNAAGITAMKGQTKKWISEYLKIQ